MKSLSAVESCWTQEFTQWWFVSTRPAGDTKEAEQPPAIRTAACCAWSTHSRAGARPYLSFNCALGRLSGVHIPSTAIADAVLNARLTANAHLLIWTHSQSRTREPG